MCMNKHWLALFMDTPSLTMFMKNHWLVIDVHEQTTV